ncbi:MAG TPA: hypothetical protein VL003_07735 [Pusillimonas sp.]|uniref:hypothetical protein n=1 Tax=Pusillimonas sp. TaxID=3040095 RepID=UPI002C2FCFE0|nr:hypothetical protein [Pusillimonas sp.]HUH87931.1 hypothetical protein [Pusillimonas sp.]
MPAFSRVKCTSDEAQKHAQQLAALRIAALADEQGIQLHDQLAALQASAPQNT